MLINNKQDHKSSMDLSSVYKSFISQLTVSEFLSVQKYFETGNDISVSGGVFYIFQSILSSDKLSENTREEMECAYLVLKTIYKLAYDCDQMEICALLQSVSRNKYIQASDEIKEYMLTEYENLNGEFMDYLWKSLSVRNDDRKKRDYFERMLKEVFIILRMCQGENSSSSDLKNDYISFISQITVNDFLKVKKFFETGNDISVSGGVFYICQSILSSENLSEEGREEFESIYLVLKTIYKLAYDSDQMEICSFMQTASTNKYIQASEGIREYMLTEYDSLKGEFINFIWQSLSTRDKDRKNGGYWERMIKEIFILLRMLS